MLLKPEIKQNGVSIEGVLYTPNGEGPFPTVILTHGFTGNYTYITGNIAKELANAGFAAYAFNLRNPDTRSMLNTSVLTEAATLDTVGFVSAYVAARREDIQALVLYYPAFVLQDDAKERNPGWDEPGHVFQDDPSFGVSAIYARDALSFDIYEVIANYHRDVLIVHGDSHGAGHGFYSGEPFRISTQYATDFLASHIQ